MFRQLRWRAMRVLTVVGNRPQFVKSAPLSMALREAGIDEVVVHTGQHWDAELSQVFFAELGLSAARAPARPPHGRRRGADARRSQRRRGGAARRRRRPRRHELHARRSARGGRRRDPPRARRGGPPQRRPLDAGGAGANRGRPPRVAPALPRRALGRDARRRRSRGKVARRRRRDGRRDASLRADRARARRAAARTWHVRRRHRPPRGERPPGPAPANRGRAFPHRGTRRLPGPPAHRVRAPSRGNRARAERRAPGAARLPRLRVRRVAGTGDR